MLYKLVKEIYCSSENQYLVVDTDTMSITEGMSSCHENYKLNCKSSPSKAFFMYLTKAEDDEIVFKINSLIFKNKEINPWSYGTKEKIIDVSTIKKQKKEVYLTMDLKNRILKVTINGRIIDSLDLKEKHSYCLVYDFIRYTVFDKSSAYFFYGNCITNDKKNTCFFQPILDMLKGRKEYEYFFKMEDIVSNSCPPYFIGDLPYRTPPGYLDTHTMFAINLKKSLLNNVTFYKTKNILGLVSMHLAALSMHLLAPGVENFVKSAYGVNLLDEYAKSTSFESERIHEVLGVEKTTIKLMNTIGNKIYNSICSLSTEIKLNKEMINDVIYPFIYQNKTNIDKGISILGGFNNVISFFEIYLNNNFYIDYIENLQKHTLYYKYYGSSESENNGKQIFTKTIQNCVDRLSKAFCITNELLEKNPLFKNNILHIFEYITSLPRTQGFGTVNNGVRYLIDYINMQTYNNAGWDKYPKSLKKVHDIASKNFNVISNANDMQDVYSGFGKAVLKYVDLDEKGETYSIIHPNSYKELFLEGCSLDHCVASYIPEVTSGNSKILFLRETKEIDKPYFTIEIKDKTIRQIKGLHQIDPDFSDKELTDFLNTWMIKNNLILNL